MPEKLPSSLLRFYFLFIKKEKRLFFCLFTSILAWPLYMTGYPHYFKLIVDSMLETPRERIWEVISYPVAYLALIKLCFEGGARLDDWMWIHFITRFRSFIRQTLFDYLQHHSYSYFSEAISGGIAQRVQEMVAKSERIFEFTIYGLYPMLLGLAVTMVMLWNANPFFALLMFAFLGLHALVYTFLGRKERRATRHYSEVSLALSARLADLFANIGLVRLFARHRFESRQLNHWQEGEALALRQARWETNKIRLILGTIDIAFTFSFMGGLFWLWHLNKITLGELTLVQSLFQNFMGSIWWLGRGTSDLLKDCVQCQHSLELFARPHQIVDVHQAPALKVSRGKIEFRDVTFGYTGDKVFRHLNLTIAPKERVGLVGFSGSGKSTLVSLLLRYFDPQEGQILIDGQDIAKVAQESLREQIALVPQDASLFCRTLFENICYGRPEASPEEVWQAAKVAHCTEFIEALPQKYQAEVGERGLKLSGGQRQRIAIARALLKKAPLLILDEATSALDTYNERLIQSSLEMLMQSKTVIVIAHRLSTLAHLDRILVFKQGELVEQGTHGELLLRGGYYAALWQLQSDGFLPLSSKGDDSQLEAL